MTKLPLMSGQRIYGIALLCATMVSSHALADVGGLRVLKENCFSCHNPEKRKAGLVMESRESFVKGGDSGAAIDLEKPENSLLLEVLAPEADPHMPPKKQLTEEDRALVAQWIASGAPWDSEALANGPERAPVQWRRLADRRWPVAAMATSPDGLSLAVSRGRRVEIFDLSDKETNSILSFEGHRDMVQSLQWRPDGKWLISGGFCRVVVWDLESGTLLRVYETDLSGRITALAFLNEGRFLVLADSVATMVGRLIVLDLSDWTVVKTLLAHDDSIYSLSVSPDGKLLASGGADNLVNLWSTETWESVAVLEGHTEYVLATGFSPQSDRIATAGADAVVKVWDLATRKQISEFSGRGSSLAITGLIWTVDPQAKDDEDNDWIVTISEDKQPRVYTKLNTHEGGQSSTGAKMRAWSGADAGLISLAFSRATEQVVAGDIQGGITLWDTAGKKGKRIE